jgi:hypothetical protein
MRKEGQGLKIYEDQPGSTLTCGAAGVGHCCGSVLFRAVAAYGAVSYFYVRSYAFVCRVGTEAEAEEQQLTAAHSDLVRFQEREMVDRHYAKFSDSNRIRLSPTEPKEVQVRKERGPWL